MIKIKSKITGKVVEHITEQDFKIDNEKIYGKDEFGNEIYFLRTAFFAEKDLTFGKTNIGGKVNE